MISRRSLFGFVLLPWAPRESAHQSLHRFLKPGHRPAQPMRLDAAYLEKLGIVFVPAMAFSTQTMKGSEDA